MSFSKSQATLARHVRMLASALALFSACTRSVDPCGQGTRWDYADQQCVRDDAQGDGDGGIAQPTSPADDSGVQNEDAGTDADMDADIDIVPDASAPPMPDASGQPDRPPPPDADTAPDANDELPDGAVPAVLCDTDDHEAWQDFHTSGGLIQAIAGCIASNPFCALGVCPLDDCLRETAGVLDCQACVTAEVECVATYCLAACGSKGTDDRCRACACSNDCVAAYNACNGGKALNVCEDCHGLDCGYALAPALIMVVVGGLLL